MSVALQMPLATRRATRRLGTAIGRALRPGDAVFLDGPLGAGKTFLVRAIARALGVPVSVPVQSPTFALVHEHPLPTGGLLVHADLYRLGGDGELRDVGLGEHRDAVLCVEWGEAYRERIAPSEGSGALSVQLASRPRSARLVPHGARGLVLLTAVREALATDLPPE